MNYFIPDTLQKIIVALDKDSEQIPIIIRPQMTMRQLNFIIASLFSFESIPTFFLVDPKDAKHAFDLSRGVSIPEDMRGFFYLDVEYKSEISYDDLYANWKNSGQTIPSGLSLEGFAKYVMKQTPVPLSNAACTLILQRFLVNALLDIVTQTKSALAISLLPYFTFGKINSALNIELISNVLIDVMVIIFADYAKMDSFKELDMIPQSQCFFSFIAKMVAEQKISYQVIRNSIGPFRPGAFAHFCVGSIAKYLLNFVQIQEMFNLCSLIFKDKWLFENNLEPALGKQILRKFDLVTFFPFLQLRFMIMSWFSKAEQDETRFLAKASQFFDKPLLLNTRIVKAVLDAFVEGIYDGIYDNGLPFLEMSGDEVESLIEQLDNSQHIFQYFLSRTYQIQMKTLTRFQKLMEKRSYEPKGFCYVFYLFLFEREVVNAQVFNDWIEKNSKGLNAVLIEINSFLISMISTPKPHKLFRIGENGKLEFD